MGIFIPGRTTCAICGGTIAERSDAAQLPYVKPSTALSPALQTRPFVHRTCWNEWEQREAVSASALALLRESQGDTEIRQLLYADHGMAVESWRTGFVRVHDTWLLVVLDLPLSVVMRFRELLSGAATDGTPTALEETGIHISRPGPDENTHLSEIAGDGEVIWSVALSPERRADWLLALETMAGRDSLTAR